MYFKTLLAAACATALLGCTEKSVDLESQMSGLNGVSIDASSYSLLKKIPERAKSRKSEAFKVFNERTQLASYLLEEEFQSTPDVHLKLIEAKNRIVINQYFDNYLSEAISDERIRVYFESNKSDFSIKLFEVSHILLKGSSENEVEQAILTAETIKSEIETGLEFSVAVDKYSQDAASKNSGGKIESLSSNNIDPAILAAIENLKSGDISDPVITMRGIQIFNIVDVKEEPVEFSKVRGKILYKLKQDAKAGEYSRILKLAQASK